VTGKVISSCRYPDNNEALTWLAAAGERAAPLLRERAAAGPTFNEFADEGWDGVEHGRIGKRRGMSIPTRR
jgi:hypothetical protein